MKRSLTGIRSSGNVHIGNYLGTIKPAIEKQSNFECLYFIADMHSLTTNKDPKAIYEQSLDVVASWIACGLDVNKYPIYRQSDVPMVTEFAWYLSCVTGYGFLEKGHAFKDAQAADKDVNHGVFAYPVLMAADILMYEPDIVPVGKDQKQHVEMARDMAGSFNAVYGEGTIKIPEVAIDERVMVIPGLDGRKMSKSYGNEIPLFCDEGTLKKKVMSIKTDSTALEAPKELKGNLVGDLYQLFATKAGYDDLAARLKAGGMGWGHAKEELFVVINDELKQKREHYNKIRSDQKFLSSVLTSGAKRAFEISMPILNKVRKAVGFQESTLKF